MIPLETIVLVKLITEPELARYFPKLKRAYFDTQGVLFDRLAKHYKEHGRLPNYPTLKEITAKLHEIPGYVKALEPHLDACVEYDFELVLATLVDEYIQNKTLVEIRRFVENIATKNVEEIKEGLTNITLQVDKLSPDDARLFDMSQLVVFKSKEQVSELKIPIGISNEFDALLHGGFHREELLLFGGPRGSGKSLICSNMVCSQYEAGYSAVYFSIEMTAEETFDRQMSILSGVPYTNIRSGDLTTSEITKLVETRASMFEGSEAVVEQFLIDRDQFKFERDLVQLPLKKNQIIIVDDRDLTIGQIDLQLQKAKALLGDTLRLVVVDYVNQLVGSSPNAMESMYEWKNQIEVSKQLKNLARKYEVLMVSPYQIAEDGKVRYATGILDAADASFIMKGKNEEGIAFTVTKMRSASDKLDFSAGVDWDTLRIDPSKTIEIRKESEDKEEKPSKKAKQEKSGEESRDLPF